MFETEVNKYHKYLRLRGGGRVKMLRGTLINLSDYFIKSFEKSVSVPRNIFLVLYYNNRLLN